MRSTPTFTSKDLTRMSHWLMLSLWAYCMASVLAGWPADTDAGLFPRIQTVLWKVGHLNLAAFIGYWLDRAAFRDRIMASTPALLHIRRAIIMAAAMLAFGLAL